MLPGRVRNVAAMRVLSLLVAAATAVQGSAKQKRNPLARLAEPWPDGKAGM